MVRWSVTSRKWAGPSKSDRRRSCGPSWSIPYILWGHCGRTISTLARRSEYQSNLSYESPRNLCCIFLPLKFTWWCLYALWGHKWQAPRCRALDAMIKKFYHGIQKAVHQFRFKNVEQHLLLGSGWNQILRPSCRRPPARTFHPPPPPPPPRRHLHWSESAVPMMAINWDEVN